MKFNNYTYVGRTAKCAVLESPTGNTVYCLFCIFKWLVHNPSLNWTEIERNHPTRDKVYKFIALD